MKLKELLIWCVSFLSLFLNFIIFFVVFFCHNKSMTQKCIHHPSNDTQNNLYIIRTSVFCRIFLQQQKNQRSFTYNSSPIAMTRWPAFTMRSQYFFVCTQFWQWFIQNDNFFVSSTFWCFNKFLFARFCFKSDWLTDWLSDWLEFN